MHAYCFAASKELRLKGVVDQDKTEQKEEEDRTPKPKKGIEGRRGRLPLKGLIEPL